MNTHESVPIKRLLTTVFQPKIRELLKFYLKRILNIVQHESNLFLLNKSWELYIKRLK